ncbi:hypothetical protein VTO42DRAFT_7319 [Malbranchea cinnamomea]
MQFRITLSLQSYGVFLLSLLHILTSAVDSDAFYFCTTGVSAAKQALVFCFAIIWSTRPSFHMHASTIVSLPAPINRVFVNSEIWCTAFFVSACFLYRYRLSACSSLLTSCSMGLVSWRQELSCLSRLGAISCLLALCCVFNTIRPLSRSAFHRFASRVLFDCL